MPHDEAPQPNGAAGPPDGTAIPGAQAVEITADDVEIARLAKLKLLDYERERPTAAEKLGIKRLSILDKLVAAERDKADIGAADKPGQGKPIVITDIEPWPEPVDGATVLDELIRAIRRYVVIDWHQANAVALWVLHTHAGDAFDTAPNLWLKSAEKRSGKTRLSGILNRLVRRPLLVSGINAAALLRLIEQYGPTILLDELDTLFQGDRELAEAVRGIINSGFDRAAAVFIKNVPTPDGGWEPRAFSTYGPKVLAGIGEMPTTIADRSIPILMLRKKREEKVARLRARDGSEFRDIACKLARWAADHLKSLAAADPEVSEDLNDRAADAWAPILAVADAVGGEWPQRAREAAVALSGEESGTQSRGEQLLADIRAAFEAKKTDRLSSDELVSYLTGLDDRPWPEINRGKPLTKASLARMLRPFKIFSGDVRFGSGAVLKGYHRQKCEDAFKRYLPSPPAENATTLQAMESAAFGGFQSATSEGDVAFSNHENPSVSVGCSVVAFSNPLPGANGDARHLSPGAMLPAADAEGVETWTL